MIYLKQISYMGSDHFCVNRAISAGLLVYERAKCGKGEFKNSLFAAAAVRFCKRENRFLIPVISARDHTLSGAAAVATAAGAFSYYKKRERLGG